MLDFQTVAAIGALAVAAYGAGLSTYIFLEKRKERQPRLQLGYRPSFLDFGGGRLSETTMNLEVSNVGTKPVRVASHSNVQILLPDGRYLIPRENWQSNVSFPTLLPPGSSLSIWRDVRGFAESLREQGFSGKVKFRVICKDEAGRVYMGKKLPFDIEGWRRSGQTSP